MVGYWHGRESVYSRAQFSPPTLARRGERGDQSRCCPSACSCCPTVLTVQSREKAPRGSIPLALCAVKPRGGRSTEIELPARKKPYKNIPPPPRSHQAAIRNAVEWAVESIEWCGGCGLLLSVPWEEADCREDFPFASNFLWNEESRRDACAQRGKINSKDEQTYPCPNPFSSSSPFPG